MWLLPQGPTANIVVMSAVSDNATLQQFRAAYAESKPYYELLNGEAVQKALPTKLHSILQGVLFMVLRELGFRSMTELTLAISETWEPIPDVCGLLGGDDGEPYPTKPIPVAIEILSPAIRSPGLFRSAVNTPHGALRTFLFSIPSAAKPGTGIPPPTTWCAANKSIHSRASPLT
jgi:hypothetical protein